MTSHALGPITHETTPADGAIEHDLAKLFPMLDADAREALEADIAANGVIEPIVFLDGHILDGRNRYYAARLHKLAYPRVEYLGDDPLGFVIGKNLRRRHLTDRQRADVAAKLAKMPRGRPSENPSIEGITVAKAADLMDVSVAAVERAKVIEEHAAPELKAAYESGEVSPSAAAEVAKLPADEQAAVVAEGDEAVLAKAKAIKERRAAERKARQAANDAYRDKSRREMEAANPQIAAIEARKAAARQARPEPVDVDALKAALAEALETIASLTSELATKDAELKTFADMKAQYDAGGFEAVIAGLREEIRVLLTRVEAESRDKVAYLRSRDFFKAEAIKLGWSNDMVIE